MQLPYSEELNIEYLGRLFDNTSECYKFFWFKAIVTKVIDGEAELSYDDLVDEMIADAWYMVTEYHLNLGPKDTLETVVNLIKQKYTELKSCEKKSVILDLLKNMEDKEIIGKKRTLTYNVPYRLQALFIPTLKGDSWKLSESNLIQRINQEQRLMYYFTALNGLSTKIRINESDRDVLFIIVSSLNRFASKLPRIFKRRQMNTYADGQKTWFDIHNFQ